MAYIDSISPELRTFEDEMEFEVRAAHYEGIAHEAKTGQPHLCSLCEKHSPNKYDFRKLTRKLNLIRFFNELENKDADPSYLAEQEHELQITPEEWSAYREEKEKRAREINF